MHCSWKAVILLALVFVAVQYALIRSITSENYSSCSDTQRCCDVKQMSSKKNHILILAATRSGSSFFGQLFNQHPDVFYLYEPLNHVQTALNSTNDNRQVILGASRDILRGLFTCNLHLLESYINPVPENHMTDAVKRRGASKALCTPPVCDAFSSSMVNISEEECLQECGYLNLTLASVSCQQRHNVVMKTVRVPVVSVIRDLLEDPRLNLKVIQLVRDPRGIVASRMMTFPEKYPMMRLWKMKGQKPRNLGFTKIPVCEDFLSSVSTGLSQPSWLRGKYMLVRYEDLAQNPLTKTQEIFAYLGISLHQHVVDWIQENTEAKGVWSPMEVFSTKRDSAANSEGWRLKLSFGMVEYLQTVCQAVLQKLGYKRVRSSGELTNLSYSLVEDMKISFQ
ncbi:carbohydrate sulfotransferase 1-like [Denticeps clupeoides]|uniref:Sulfotransferase n=1 Tax=Denticeps clupeoides TaxID=299321 RepID=A0AAY4DCC3_9TELE|nr:carbohydrate sulfotransferase 1-like [Denticeps clupeoides]